MECSQITDYYKSRIINIYFNLSCNNNYVCNDLFNFLRELTYEKNKKRKIEGIDILSDKYECLRLLYMLIGHTRDGCLYAGRGQRDLSYKMIHIWYQFFPVLAIFMVHRLFDTFGSFKDIKRFCKCIAEVSSRKEDDPLIDIVVTLSNKVLYNQYKNLNSGVFFPTAGNPSFYLPRESSSLDWLYKKFAKDWMFQYIPQLESSGSLSYKKYRKIVQKCNSNASSNNRYYIPMYNEKSMGIFIRNAERIIYKYKKDTSNSLQASDSLFIDIQLLNVKWNSFMSVSKFYYNTKNIPIVDVSVEGGDDAYYCGLGFGLLLAMTGSQRILISSHIPIWVDLTECPCFYDAFCKVTDGFGSTRTCCDWQGSQQLLMNSLKASRILDKGIDLRFMLFSGVWRPLNHTIPIIYWNTGSTVNIVDSLHDCSGVFMSGENITLFSAFLELLDNKKNRVDSSFEVICYFLETTQYKCLSEYFSMFCYRLME